MARNPAKTFGKPRTTPVERIPFSLWVERDDVAEEHHFQARVVDDFAALVVSAINARKDTEKAVSGMFAFMAKIMDNRDGVPAEWSPTPLPPKPLEEVPASAYDPVPAAGWPADEPVDPSRMTGELVVQPQVFRAPAVPDGHPLAEFRGKLVPLEHAPEFLHTELGSSRRRWNELMSEDSDVSVRQADLVATFEWMMGLAANRPTQPSS